MISLRDLSFRYKIPLRASLLVVITAVLVTVFLIVQEYDNLRRDLVTRSSDLSHVLARTLMTPLKNDDVWRAYEVISSLGHDASVGTTAEGAPLILVLDAQERVFVTTDPRRYPLLTDPVLANADLSRLRPLPAGSGQDGHVIDTGESSMIYTVEPIVMNDDRLGTLIMGFSKNAFLPRFFAIAGRAALVTAAVIAVLIPASWLWARRFAQPLVTLATGMETLAKRIPEDSEIVVEESRDELGKVGTAFKLMVRELREKVALKRQILMSERLAAVGRLSAAIAHEINNPLGGMLNAINTLKHHGHSDPLTMRSIQLIERGLLQIKDTLSALLVEAKVEEHPLDRQDVEDIRTLVAADAQYKRATLDWDNDIIGELPLPSTLIRQVLMNLMLNALHAVDAGGKVSCRVYRDSARVYLRVGNDGAFIPKEDMEYLFEPFWSKNEGGHGLGLWVTYQIVNQLQGEIAVNSAPGNTEFLVTVPFARPVLRRAG